MTKKRFYLALQGLHYYADVEDALGVLREGLPGKDGIYVEDMRDLEDCVREHRYKLVGDRVEEARKKRIGLSRWEEEELEDKFTREYGQLPVYEFTIRKIGYMDDTQEAKFHSEIEK